MEKFYWRGDRLRSRVEAKMNRMKLLGVTFAARDIGAAEFHGRINILNRFIAFGFPAGLRQEGKRKPDRRAICAAETFSLPLWRNTSCKLAKPGEVVCVLEPLRSA
ncbi:hypothetical protein [Jannaschia marina]|uniref:hypothetical protein n=1 Tax=Jannaschia marina TaxID=2741674 RepID=UPI0015C722B9|nr:hypothetical protein [Jannaschia marina]